MHLDTAMSTISTFDEVENNDVNYSLDYVVIK